MSGLDVRIISVTSSPRPKRLSWAIPQASTWRRSSAFVTAIMWIARCYRWIDRTPNVGAYALSPLADVNLTTTVNQLGGDTLLRLTGEPPRLQPP